jgi:hypothetical protein
LSLPKGITSFFLKEIGFHVFFETLIFLAGLLAEVVYHDSRNWEEDEGLAARIKNGDREALTGLIDKYQDSV